jgi:hypothetical protein
MARPVCIPKFSAPRRSGRAFGNTTTVPASMSPKLKAILEAPPDPTGEAFKRAIRDSSLELKDEYLSTVLAQHSQRRFVEEERKRHAERIEVEETARRHREAIDQNRRANRLSLWAIVIAIGAAVIAGVSLYWQWEGRSAGKPKPAPQAAAPAILPPAPAVALPLTNVTRTNIPQQTP